MLIDQFRKGYWNAVWCLLAEVKNYRMCALWCILEQTRITYFAFIFFFKKLKGKRII
jgi:hypothetical protein